jgi:hypothetical protein
MSANLTTALLAAGATSVVAVAVWLGMSSLRAEQPATDRDCDPLDPW